MEIDCAIVWILFLFLGGSESEENAVLSVTFVKQEMVSTSGNTLEVEENAVLSIASVKQEPVFWVTFIRLTLLQAFLDLLEGYKPVSLCLVALSPKFFLENHDWAGMKISLAWRKCVMPEPFTILSRVFLYWFECAGQ